MKRMIITLLSAIALTIGLSGVSSQAATAADNTEQVTSQDTDWSPGAAKAPAESDSATPVVTETNYEKDCVTEGNKTTCTHGSASASSTAKGSSIADIRIKGRIAGEFFIKGGLTKKQVAGKKCRWISGGYNSARRADGSPFSYRDERKQYVCKTGKGPTGFQVVKCGNPYSPPGWQPTFVVVRNPVIVRSLENYMLTGRAKVKSVSKSYSESETTATCVGSNGYGYGEATSNATAIARIRFTFRHRSNFSGELHNAIIRHNESINVKGFAEVATRTKTKAKTEANCSDQEPSYQCPPGTTWEDKDGDGKQEEGECITPPQPNKPPTCELVQYPQHMYVSMPGKEPNRYRAKAVWSDPDEQLTQNSASVSVTGQAFIVKGNSMFPERWDVEGTQVVYTFWIETTQQTGNATLSMDVTDSKGAKCSDAETFPVVADEF